MVAFCLRDFAINLLVCFSVFQMWYVFLAGPVRYLSMNNNFVSIKLGHFVWVLIAYIFGQNKEIENHFSDDKLKKDQVV